MLNAEIRRDLERAQKALASAERNFQENDISTAANRTFVACENAVYVLLKSRFGSTSVSRQRILTRLGEVYQEVKEVYDQSYDLRVQADYGRQETRLPLNKENMQQVLKNVKGLVREAEIIVRTQVENKEQRF